MQPLSDRTAGFTDSVIRRIDPYLQPIRRGETFPTASRILTRPKQFWTVWPRSRTRTTTSTPSPGRAELREALAAKQTRYMGRTIDPNSEIVVTCGSTEAMMAAMMTVTNPGDKVIIFSPFYENYGADTILSGAEPIYVPPRAAGFPL